MKIFSICRLLTVIMLFPISNSFAQSQSFSAIADAQVYEGNAANNYGTTNSLQVKRTYGSSNIRTSYLKFDLSSFNLYQIGKAVIRLYLRTNDNQPVPAIIEAIHVIDNNWNENTIVWNNKPATSRSIATTFVQAQGRFYEWDITEFIKELSPSSTNNTIITIALQDITGSNALLTFSSKDHTNNRPQLIINETPHSNLANGTFYIDAENGNDTNNGRSEVTPWKTLDMPNSKKFQSGSQILFKSGQTFKGTLIVTGNGTAQLPVIYATYGGATPAIIDAEGKKTAIYVYNKEYLEIKNLSITNYRNTPITDVDLFHGIVITNQNAGTLNHIYLDGLKVFNVNSADGAEVNGTKSHGGVLFDVFGTDIQSKWNDVLIQNCLFENLSRTGVNFESDWELRNSNTSFGDDLGDGRKDNWLPSTNVVIKNNAFKHIAGNGLVVRVAVNPLIEFNLFDYCGKTISGNAVFNFNTDGALYQFNEAKNTVYNQGDTDARGIDSDFRTKDTYIQFNYLHNNGLGGVVATGGNHVNNPPSIPERFNINTIIRYNIVENNERQAVSFSGNMKSAEVYNNVFFADETRNNVVIVRLAEWSVHPKNINFKNNIFSFKGTGNTYSITGSSTYSFLNNIFDTGTIANEPADPQKIKANPLFLDPGKGPDGYKLKPGSPALNSGLSIANNGGRDYYNNPVSTSGTTNIGAYSGEGTLLPVGLLYFNYKKSNYYITLNWATSFEKDNSHFEIERSEDGIFFYKLHQINGKIQSDEMTNYTYLDTRPINGINYYRLKQIDLNSDFKYSEVLAVKFGLNEDNEPKLYPNPASSHIRFLYDKQKNEELFVNIYGIDGVLVLQQQINTGSELTVNISSLNTGVYMVKLLKKDGSTLGEMKMLKI